MLSKRIRLSKQTLGIWHQSVQQDAANSLFAIAMAAALALHLGIFVLTKQIENSSTNSVPKQQSVRVELRTPMSNTNAAVKKPAPEIKDKIDSPKRLRTLNSQSRSKAKTEIEIPTTVYEPPPQESQQLSGLKLPEERQSPLLPSGSLDFIEKQRMLGEVLGAGAVAGDLEIPDIVSEAKQNSEVRAIEYTFAGYFNSLSRRFVEAWGGVRTLPPQSHFDGKLGEFIEYDVVINRDGSLRKIVNVSAKREPYRDFTAVDELVREAFQAMFPFQPVPERIKNDPLVVRKRIQFVGFKYTLY